MIQDSRYNWYYCCKSTCIVFQWMEEDFLHYLKEWEKQVMSYDDLDDKAKMKMLLSKETREGLHITDA